MDSEGLWEEEEEEEEEGFHGVTRLDAVPVGAGGRFPRTRRKPGANYGPMIRRHSGVEVMALINDEARRRLGISNQWLPSKATCLRCWKHNSSGDAEFDCQISDEFRLISEPELMRLWIKG